VKTGTRQQAIGNRQESFDQDIPFIDEVNMPSEITLDELRVRAARAGLDLSEDELKQLLPGVNRADRQVNELRALLSEDDEPASVFGAPPSKE
jgi:hypothetical protein